MLLALLILAALIIIGFIRFRSQKNQEVQESPQIVDETPSSYQTTQEADESYYREAFSSSEPERGPIEDPVEVISEPKPKKSPVTKKSSTKGSSTKKTPGKKATAKKSPSKKTNK